MINKTKFNWSGVAGAAAGAGGGLLGMIGNKKREERALKNQKDLMNMQFQNQKSLNEQGKELALQQWKETSYPAQMKLMKEAGLNPALMYGGAGSGGSTSAGSGGSAASGGAPAPMNSVMEIGLITQMIQAVADVALKGEQTKEKTLDVREKRADIVEKELFKPNTTRSTLRNEADLANKEMEARSTEENGENIFVKGLVDESKSKSITRLLQEAVTRGTVSDNEVKAYKAELAKAKIDPDSDPLVREIMKAMAAEGMPISEILRKVVKVFM